MEATNNLINLSVKRGSIRGPKRSSAGLIINVSVRPDVEQLMAGFGAGNSQAADNYNEGWISLDGSPIMVYDINDEFSSTSDYLINRIGSGPLVQDNNRLVRTVNDITYTPNISFLRIVGAGNKEGGVTFGVVGLFSADYVNRMRMQLPKALSKFVQDFMSPMNLNFQVISRNA